MWEALSLSGIPRETSLPLNKALEPLFISSYVVLSFYSMDGQLEFWDINDMTQMNAAEHSQATDLVWDPTGRYVVTSISAWNQKAS